MWEFQKGFHVNFNNFIFFQLNKSCTIGTSLARLRTHSARTKRLFYDWLTNLDCCRVEQKQLNM